MKRSMLLAAVALFALAALQPGLAAPAQAQTTLPSSLEGEMFLAYESTFFVQGKAEVNATCTPPEGETMTVTYRAEGLAVGPYTGPFIESGTAKATMLAAQPSFLGGSLAYATMIEWKATFTIDSPAGKVTGTKTLTALTQAYAYCLSDAFTGAAFYDAEGSFGNLDYEATIKPPTGGTFSDQGKATAHAEETCLSETKDAPSCDVSQSDYFSEYFYLSTGVLPLDTHGKATGGGQILSGSDPLERVTFGFNVRKDEDETRLQGTCNVLDHATGTHVKCLNVTDYQQIGNTASWEGTAEVNGVEEDYRITVQDNGEPNQGLDTFSIVTDSYDAAGNVQHGNVQLHKQELGL